MEKHSLTLLEFSKIQAAVAHLAALEASRAAVAELLVPTTDPETMLRRRDSISELVRLLRQGFDFTIPPLADPAPSFQHARIEDSFLPAAELLQIAGLLQTAATLHRFFKAHHEDAPLLARLAGRLFIMPEVQAHLARAINEDGTVNDNASPQLKHIRHEIRTVRARLEKRLDHLLHETSLADAFAGDRATWRSGRLVLPVRATRWTAVGGLVHDRSNTGQTFFVEPAVTIELGNELQNLAAEEETELRRILLDLTRTLRPHLDELALSFQVLVQIDLLRAASLLAERRKMSPAEIQEPGRPLELVEARHPVLESALEAEGRADQLMPLTLRLDPEMRTMAITGSNTGGKTVALKTIGLVALMAQAGLHVPARRAVLPIFDRVLADIGDEQSIEQSLSTFSGHMSRIVRILEQSGERSLVLLDELGSGTDPAEGGALACAILATLLAKRTTTLVTTHLREVKIFCHERPGMQNAAMEFDSSTLRPTYRLVQGEPGQSHALTIARRLGLPQDVFELARSFLSDEHLNLEQVLAKMTEERRKLRAELDQAELDRAQAAADRQKMREELATLKKERKAMLREAYQQASGIVDNTQREMQNLLKQIRQQGGDQGPDVEALRQKVREKKGALRKGSAAAEEHERPRLRPESLKVGQTVYVERFRATGLVQSVDLRKNRVTVTVGAMVIELKPADLSQPSAKEMPAAEGHAEVKVTRASETSSMEINLIGQRAAEAIANLERFLDQACMAGYPQVMVIHGRGTGALMKAVHEQLRGNPLVETYRSGNEAEGGVAVTVAKFKE